MTEFQVTGIFKKNYFLHTWASILVPIKITGNFPGKIFTTEIHRESHSHINTHTITVSHNLVFFMQIFLQLHC